LGHGAGACAIRHDRAAGVVASVTDRRAPCAPCAHWRSRGGSKRLPLARNVRASPRDAARLPCNTIDVKCEALKSRRVGSDNPANGDEQSKPGSGVAG